MSVFLNQFKIIKPKNLMSQGQLLHWIIKAHQKAEHYNQNSDQMSADTIAKLFERYGVKPTQISQRYTECDDMFSETFESNEVYKIQSHEKEGTNISDRSEFFSDRALNIFKKIYDLTEENAAITKRPNHLIHVTCTGYVSPSAAQRVITDKKWNQATDVTHAYHMGCYAAMPAVRLAKSLVQSESLQNPDFTTDIVHTEMCTLHMNPASQTPEQMVVQTLFADGHVKYTAAHAPNLNGKNLKVIALLEKVLPDSEQDMSWVPAPWGMQMNLSREVPAKIKLELRNFSKELFSKAGLDVETALKSVFAIHPGGPKIIDSVQEVLELTEDQVIHSKKILFERGNMSSATLPHVWNEILEHKYSAGTKVISYAFGPGLTLFGSVFEVC